MALESVPQVTESPSPHSKPDIPPLAMPGQFGAAKGAEGRVTGYVGSSLIFVVVFLSACLVSARLLPPRDIYQVILEKASRPADIVLLGSSFTAVDLLPDVMEAELSQAGIEADVVNLAMYGSREFENEYLLHRIEPFLREARMVILDFRDWTVDSAYGGMVTERGAQWHDFRTWRSVMTYMFRNDLLTWDRFSKHTLCFLWHYVPLGRALSPEFEDPVPEIQASRESGGGFDMNGVSYEDMLAATDQLRLHPELQTLYGKEIGERIAWLEALGLEVFVFLPPAPTAVNWRVINTVQSVAPHVRFLNFDSRTFYPELYERKNRWDYSHLNQSGATLCSQYVARQLAPHLKSP